MVSRRDTRVLHAIISHLRPRRRRAYARRRGELEPSANAAWPSGSHPVNNFAEFFADFPDDAVRGIGGVVQVPNGKAMSRMIGDRLRAAGHSASPPEVAGRWWSFIVTVRRGTVECKLQYRDRWCLATESREGTAARLFGRRRLDEDHAEVNAVIDRVLRSRDGIRDVHWYSKEDIEARVAPIPAATYDELRSHGLSEAFARFVTDGRRHIAEVSYWCDDPDESWRYYVAPEIERPRQLWSTNADPTVVALMKGKTAFLQLYHDDIGYRVIGHSETAIATSLLAEVLESEDWEDEDDTRRRLRGVATAMGYPHFDALDAYSASTDSGNLSELIRRLEGDAD